MKECIYCKINVGGDAVKCPLCQNRLKGEGTENNWPSPDLLQKESILYKLQLFLVLSAVIISLSLDFLFQISNGFHWSLLLTMWLIAFEFGIIRLFHRNFSSSRILTLFAIVISFLLIVTSLYAGHFSEVGGIVVPYICIGTLIANFVLMLIDKTSNAMVYLLSNIVIGISPYLVLLAFGKNIPLAWVICLVISVLLFVGAVIFKGRQVASEIQKRFHM